MTSKLTPADLAELKRLLAEATPGPWSVDPDYRPGMRWNNHIVAPGDKTVCFMSHDGTDENKVGEANAELIETLRNVAPALIAAAEDSERMRAELDGALATMMAAAVEIQEHWDAHCDMDGYGPANLVRRLEKGFCDAGYGYSASAVIELTNEIDKLNAELEQARRERDEAYERAAQVCDAMKSMSPRKSYQDAAAWLAVRIRALKEKP